MNTDNNYSPEEAARRRDEVVRRMANTPPQPRQAKPPNRPKKAKATGVRQAAKRAARRGKSVP